MSHFSSGRRVLGVLAAASAALTPGIVPASASAKPVARSYIVLASNDHADLRSSLRRVGARRIARLDLIGGLTARMTARQAGRLRRVAGVRSVVLNLPAPSRDLAPLGEFDTGKLSYVTDLVGANALWRVGATGRGIDIAIIDTGVSPALGLTDPGKVVLGPDLSLDAGDPAARQSDGYGHGTHLASIAAGRSAPAGADYRAASSAGALVGVAPDARIVSVRVGAHDGVADITQVVAGITWATEHAHSDGLNIRVILVSYGTDAQLGYRRDPLALAAEAAWRKGIVVIAAGGNDGFVDRTDALVGPARDPFVIAVGALDPRRTASPGDDAVAEFSSRGNDAVDGSLRPPDLLAPGRSIEAGRAVGSEADLTAGAQPETASDRLRGSGTSQAAAVVAGAAALVLSAMPNATPDIVKAALVGSAKPLPNASIRAQGYGRVDLRGLLRPAFRLPWTMQGFDPAVPDEMALDEARGSARITIDGHDITGAIDVFGRPVVDDLARRIDAGTSWEGGVFNGAAWTGSGWGEPSWAGNAWQGLPLPPAVVPPSPGGVPVTDVVHGGVKPGSTTAIEDPTEVPTDPVDAGSEPPVVGWTRSSWSRSSWSRSSWSTGAWN